MDEKALREEMLRRRRGFELSDQLRVESLKARTHEEWLRSLPGLFKIRESSPYLFQAALNLQNHVAEANYSCVFVGTVVQQKWGEVRMTTDIDLKVICDSARFDEVSQLLDEHLSRVDCRTRAQWPSNRHYFGRSPDGFDVDVYIGSSPFEERLERRAILQDYGLHSPLRICSAEDLVITKATANNHYDFCDLERVIQRSGEAIDWTLVFQELSDLQEWCGSEDRLPLLKQMILNEYPDGLPGVPPSE